MFTDYIHLLDSEYHFYLIKPHNTEEIETYLNNHFRQLNGKIFSPYEPHDSRFGIFIIGLEKQFKSDNTELINSLHANFNIKEYKLGEEPYDYYNNTDGTANS